VKVKRLGGKILIAAVGRLKTPHWKTAQNEYLERLNRYTSARLVEVKDAVGRGDPDDVANRQEGRLLLEASKGAGRRIALDRGGRQLDSPGLASHLEKQLEVYGKLALLIGGPLGLSREALGACEERLSLSAMTLPHELARVLLLEQLYRAATILGGEKYHK
jgi:23S rRNA (pseudouridine1915-N3)-methyltransferase